MSGLIYAKCFSDLIVYQRAFEVAKSIFEISRSFPKEETYSLTDQIRRSSRSNGAQIAEAWGKKNYERHFISKLTDSDAEQLETLHWLNVAISCNYLNSVQAQPIIISLNEIGKMIHSMISKSYLFCNPDKVFEHQSEYMTT